ncbi:tetratricopeptide repeat protein [Thiotrichales bacterium 19S9-12]|nr:tetratricopeptide repeat protein [Thiotrichales bacterium 19S9-11]MCF6811450.1 tetratricopeptide repeat protein [Thiotrichales bacterium 19S9-12]
MQANINDVFTLCQKGKFDQAEDLCCFFLKKNEHDYNILYLLGGVYLQQDKLEAAFKCFSKVIDLNPKHYDAYNSCGVIFQKQGKLNQAVIYYEKAVQINPNLYNAYSNLAVALQKLKRPNEAIINYEKIIQLKPNDYKAYYDLANILQSQNQLDQSVNIFQKAIALNPGESQIYNNLGISLQKLGQLDDAMTNYKKAIQINPNFNAAYYNLANLLKEKQSFSDAIKNYEIAIKLNPNDAKAYNDLALIYKDQQQFDQAVKHCKKAIQINPNYHEAYTNLGMIQLYFLDFENGWKNYQHRVYVKINNLYSLQTNKPEYIGQDLNNKTIYLYHEQGFGDTIMVLRFLSNFIKMNAHIVLYVPISLARLVEENFPTVEVTTKPYQKHYDYHLPAMNIPMALNINNSNMPLTARYLIASNTIVATYKAKFFQNDKQNIGLVWKGNPKHKNDHNRSLDLKTLLKRVKRTSSQQYYSLQVDASSDEKQLLAENNIIDLGSSFNNFYDTITTLSCLNTLIAVDTSIVHLSGALNVSTYLLLPKIGVDWRWGYQGETSYWYDSVRLIRDDRMISL